MSVDYDRRNSLSLEQVSFEGTDGEDVTLFLRSVRRVAFAQGLQRDEQWLTDYVESCLAGPALIWHLDLDETVGCSWAALQRALLSRFAVPPQAAPTPPQAAPAVSRPVVSMGPPPPLPSQLGSESMKVCQNFKEACSPTHCSLNPLSVSIIRRL